MNYFILLVLRMNYNVFKKAQYDFVLSVWQWKEMNLIPKKKVRNKGKATIFLFSGGGEHNGDYFLMFYDIFLRFRASFVVISFVQPIISFLL